MCRKQIHTSIYSSKNSMRSLLVKTTRDTAYKLIKKSLNNEKYDKVVSRDIFEEFFILDGEVELTIILTDNFDSTVTVNIIAYSKKLLANKKEAIQKLKSKLIEPLKFYLV